MRAWTRNKWLPPEALEFRSKPAYQRLIIMLGGVTVNFILAFIIYIGMAFAYGDTYIANSDLQDGLMIENQAMLNAGFKTGDKIIAADGEKIAKFDNDINIKIIAMKAVLIEGTQETIKMPIDFIDQLSKFEKSLVSIECRLLLRAFQKARVNTSLESKDLVLFP
jgi:regulator of sigma E protease